MSTPSETIRVKAQRIIMLSALVKAQCEQEDYASMFKSIDDLHNAAEEARIYSMENNLFEGMVIFTNATTLIFQTYVYFDFWDLAVSYSMGIALAAFRLLYHLENNNPDVIEEDKKAHMMLSYLGQVYGAFSNAANLDANRESMWSQDILDPFFEVVSYFQGVYEYLKRVAPQSLYLDRYGKMKELARKIAVPEDRHFDWTIGDIIAACCDLADEVSKITIKNE